jgi:TPR repeat protein
MNVTSHDEIIFASGLRAAREGRYKDAFDLWKPLADGGHKEAQRNIGYLTYLGLGVARNAEQAAGWLARAETESKEDPVAVFRTIDRLAAGGARPSAVFARAL